jgi:magnesium-transporting ATPase (P-type)
LTDSKIIHKFNEEEEINFINGKIEILQKLEFSSENKRMGIIIKLNDEIYIITKGFIEYNQGSPEKILENLKEKNELIYKEELNKHTEKGFRVLSLSIKLINEYNPKSYFTDFEYDMQFLCFLIFENQVKENTGDVITELRNSNITTLMITGDNPLTSINVAKKINLIDHEKIVFLSTESNNNTDQYIWKSNNNEYIDTINFTNIENDNFEFCITGDIFNKILINSKNNSKNIFKIIEKIKIFSRMTPIQKMKLINLLQKNYYVGMIGDGANDTSSLKVSHCGISISQTENSIAAPFTSLKENIECVLHLIKEGRCSISISFQLLKFILLMSITQTLGALFLFSINSNFSVNFYLTFRIFNISTMTYL